MEQRHEAQPSKVGATPTLTPTAPGRGPWSSSTPTRTPIGTGQGDDGGAILINRAALSAWMYGQPYADE